MHADGTKIRRCVSKPLPELSKEQQDTLKLRFIYAVSNLLIRFSVLQFTVYLTVTVTIMFNVRSKNDE